MLDSSADIEQALELASRFDQQCPRISVVLVTELFREARFSTHAMPPGARADASRALARVAADLTDVRA